jgi:flagellar biosynthetic protein FlhB
MSEEPDSGDKSFEPTPKRLEEARRRGEVPLSADLATAAAYGGFLVAAAWLGAGSLLALGAALATLLAQAAPLSEALFGGGAGPSGAPIFGAVAVATAAALWPWVLLPAAAALLAVAAQGVLVVAPERIRPKGARLSPLATLKQRFGTDGLVEFVKGLVKLTALLLAGWWAVADDLGLLLALPALGARPSIAAALGLGLDLLVAVTLVAAVLGLLDLAWQRLSFRRRHRMSRREVTDELKESEGDPQARHQRRQRGQGIAMNRMLEDLPRADVVIVNPTHYAVALRWDRGSGRAPLCVAKGVDEIAHRIRERAALAGVPIRSDPPTARALYATVEIGQEVGRAEWRAVAAAIRFAERIRRQMLRR